MPYEPSCLALLGLDVSLVSGPAHPTTPGKPEVFRIVDVRWRDLTSTCLLLAVSCSDDRLRVLSADEVVLLVQDPARLCLVPHRRRA